MKPKEFHDINKNFFKDQLELLGFTPSNKSKWLRQSGDVGIEFAVRLNSYGWQEQYGSSFIYEVLPWYKNKPVYYYPAKQIRMHELLTINSSCMPAFEKILNQFSSKIPSYENYDSDLYIFLKSTWSERKINENSGHWFYFYDREDLLAWHEATYHTLIKAVENWAHDFKEQDFNHLNNHHDKQFEKATMVIDASGEIIMKPDAKGLKKLQ